MNNSFVPLISNERYCLNLLQADLSFESIRIFVLFRGRKIFEPPRFMTVKQASEQLLEIVENKRQEGDNSLGKL